MTDHQEENATEKTDADILDEISQEERILVILREELYEGSWDNMEQDLEDRLEGRPYIFKLHNRIEDDLERIERLREFEEEHQLDLSDHIEDIEKEEE